MPKRAKTPEVVNTPDTHESTARGSDSPFPTAPPQSDQVPGPIPEDKLPPPPGPSGTARTINTVKRELPCTLTPDELRDRSLQLARSFTEIASEESRQSQIKDELKGIMSRLFRRQSELALAVQTGEEKREVDVDFVMLGDDETISEVRRDTMKPIATRPATAYERQGKMFPDKEPLFSED